MVAKSCSYRCGVLASSGAAYCAALRILFTLLARSEIDGLPVLGMSEVGWCGRPDYSDLHSVPVACLSRVYLKP